MVSLPSKEMLEGVKGLGPSRPGTTTPGPAPSLPQAANPRGATSPAEGTQVAAGGHKAISKSLLMAKCKYPCRRGSRTGKLLLRVAPPTHTIFISTLVPENGYLCIFNIQGKRSITQSCVAAAHYSSPAETSLFHLVYQLRGSKAGLGLPSPC